MPRVSVIVPAYNAEGTIDRAVASVLSQTMTDLEVLVCDDGSTDGTAAKLAACGDGRLRVLRQENRGRGAARNRALAEARGHYVALLDADDWWLPTKLAGDVSLLDSQPDDMLVFANLYVMNRAGHLYRTMNGKWTVAHSGRVFPLLLQGNFVPTSTVTLPRRVALAVGGFDPSLVRGQDWEWLLRLAARVPFRYRNEVVGYYDAHSWGSDEKTVATQEGVLQLLETLQRHHSALVASYSAAFNRSYATACIGLARHAESKGDFRAAASLYARALERTPDDDRVLWARAMALYQQDAWTEASEALRAHVARHPWTSLPRFYLGNVALATSAYESAREELEHGLFVGPLDQQFPECVNNLGVACWHIGDRVRARELFEQALQQREFYSDALWNLLHIDQATGAEPLRWTRRKVF